MTTLPLSEEKRLLRKKVAESLQKLGRVEIERQSDIVTQRVLKSRLYRDAGSLAIFLSMPGREVSTRDIVLQALDDGKSVFVPYLHTLESGHGKIMHMLQLHDKNDFEALQPDGWGIPSLPRKSIADRRNALGGVGIPVESNTQHPSPCLDLIFMPAVAFDQSRHRLGHGKGFYDRYLQAYQQVLVQTSSEKHMPRLVGLALGEQLLSSGESIPVNEDDWKVDEVVSAQDE